MENSFLNQIKNLINPEFINALSINSSDSKEGIQRAFDVAIPSLLMKFKETDATVLQSVLLKAKEVFTDSSDFSFKLNNISSMLSVLFDGNYDDFKKSISQYANISNTSSESVLKSSMIGILDYLKGISPNFNISEIQSGIASHLPSLKGLIPASIGGLGLSSLTNKTEIVENNIHDVVNENTPNQYKTNEPIYKKEKSDGGGGFLKVLLPLLIGVGAIFFFYKMCSKEKLTTEQTVVTDTIVQQQDTSTSIESPAVVTRESQIVKLYDGTELNAYKGGIEEQLVAFLEKGDYKKMSPDELKTIWFDFDYLNFDTGSATITTDTKIQLDNIAAILKAYPEAAIKIGGYTDKVGNEANNVKLSTERANAVKTYLSDKGFASQIDGAEGYGSEFAKYASDAPEEQRVLDRRVSLSVRNK